jgi:exopolysaccharide production protein ExoQ
LRQVATLLYAAGILVLFLLNRDPKTKTSGAIFVPFFWMLVAGSRNVGEWLQMGAPTDGGDAYLEGNPFDRNLLAGLVALGLIILIRRRKRVAKILKSNLPVLLFFSYCALSILWSDYPFVGLKRCVRASGDLVMVLIILSEIDSLGARKKILAWTSFLVLPLSILLIRYYPNLGRAFGTWDYAVSWTGVSSTKNGLGMISMMFGLASESRFLDAFLGQKTANRTRLLIAHGIVLATAVYLIHMANSATSLACFVFGSAVLVSTYYRPLIQRPALVHCLVGTILFVAFSALFLNLGSGLVEDLGRNSTLTGRTDVWRRVVTLVTNPIFGSGFESFWIGPRLARMRSLDPGLNQAHNGYIEVYLNLGWVGIISLAAVILTGYRNIVAALRQDPDPARLRLVYFVVALSYNFTEAAFKMMNPVWILFLLAIIAIPETAVPNLAYPMPPRHGRPLAKPKIYIDKSRDVGLRKRRFETV